MINILLEGFYGKHNLGDDYIFISVINTLRKSKNVEAIYVIVWNDDYSYLSEYLEKENIKGITLVKKGESTSEQLKQFDSLLKRVDYWIIGGGGLFPKEDAKILMKYSMRIFMAKRRHVLIGMYGIEINPVNKLLSKKIWCFIVNKCEFIAGRNSGTKSFLDSVHAHEAISFSDVTFSYDDKNVNRLYEESYELWAVAMPWSDVELGEEKYLNRYKQLCQQLAYLLDKSTSKTVLFLPFYGGRDIKFIRDILSLSSNLRISKKIVGESIPFYKLRALYKYADKCLCMRYHSLLFALYYERKFLAISYSPKTTMLLHENGLEEYMIEFGIRNSEFFYKEFDMDEIVLNQKYEKIEDESKEKIAAVSNRLKKQAINGEQYLLNYLGRQ